MNKAYEIENLFSIFDLFIFFITSSFVFVIIYIFQKKYIEKKNQFIFVVAFVYKYIMCLLNLLLVNILGGYDTILYYSCITDLSHCEFDIFLSFIFEFDENNLEKLSYTIFNNDYYHYMSINSNSLFVKFGAIVNIVCFDSYSSITMLLSTFSFLGSWAVYKTFLKIFPSFKNVLLVSFLFLPSVQFWSSGLLKDTITYGCLGLIVSAFFELYFFKSYGKIIQLVIFSIILYFIKSYILFSIAIGFIFFLYFNSGLAKNFYLFIFIISCCFIVFNVFGSTLLESIISFSLKQESFIDQIEGSSNVVIFEYDFSFWGIVKMITLSIFAVLFRPFVWESVNLMLLISSLETLFFQLYFLYVLIKLKSFNFILSNKNENITSFLIPFIFVLALVIGFTTFNFGTISRYKIPLLPYFLFFLSILRSASLKKKYNNL